MSTLSTEDLFAALDQVQAPSQFDRTLATWAVLRQAKAEDYSVAVDYALEHDLLPMSSAAGHDARNGQIQTTYWVNDIDSSQMVWIAPGPFVVGEERQPAASEGFYLARYPVTNAQFRRFLDETGYTPAADDKSAEDFLKHWKLGAIPAGCENHPVVWVSLVDAVAYCHWAKLSLPTEWLWEKAARGPEGRNYPWGNNRPTKQLANMASEVTMPVDSYPRTRTPYGCEDLAGNASEWCLPSEAPGAFPTELPEFDISEPAEPVVVRGGCFLRQRSNSLTGFHRRRLSPLRRNRWTGFRLAVYPQG